MRCKTVCGVTFLLYLFSSCSKTDALPTCEERNKNCCLGYLWNSSTNACEKCMSGYAGLNCSDKCPYPSYGKNCQGICNCSEIQCDISRGCNNLTSECLPGHTELDCFSKCPYPSYGKNCQGICNCSEIQCDISRGCSAIPSGTTTAQEINPWKESDSLLNMKTIVSSNNSFGQNVPENRDKIFIFITFLGCIGLVLLSAHLIVYIVDRRHRSISLTTTCQSIPEQCSMYENINGISSLAIE